MSYIIICLILISFLFVISEVIFRFYSKNKKGRIYSPIGKAKYKDYVTKYRAYPYLPYLLNEHKSSGKESKDPRKFAPKNSTVKEFDVNEFGMYDVCNTNKFKRDYDKKLVLMLGSSVLEGIVWNDDVPISIGSELSLLLNTPEEKYQVVNCAMAGWLSNEIYLYFSLVFSHFKPDYIVYYHGANDVLACLSDNFKPDYSHYRKSLAEILPKVKKQLIASTLFPCIRKFTLYEYILRKAGLRFHPLYELSKLLRPNEPKKENIDCLKGNLKTEKHYLELIFATGSALNSQIIAIPYLFWNYDRKSEWQNIQCEGVDAENENLWEVCKKQDIELLDLNDTLEKSEMNFLDEQHLNENGIKFFANRIFKKILGLNGEE